MTRILALSLLVTLAACSRRPAPVDRAAFLAGASGDAFFAQDLAAFRDGLKARGWEVREAIGEKATNEAILSGAHETLSSVKPGGEALIAFHTHGREREAGWGQRTHSIVTEDRDGTGNDPGLDLDALEPELVAAKERGVRVALIDLSCYSGNSQRLRGVGCAVTLAAPRYVSLCSGRDEEKLFASRFLKLPAPGQAADLESQFLAARRSEAASVNLPIISSRTTPAADEWDELLYQVDPLDIFEDLKDLRAGGAKPFDPRPLLAALDAESRPAVRETVSELLSIRAKLEKAMPALAKDYDATSLRLSFAGATDALPISPGALFELLEGKTDGYSDVKRRLAARVGGARSTIEADFERPLSEFRRRRDDFDQLTEQLELTAGLLFRRERAVYDRDSRKVSDGCSTFAL